MSFDVLCTTVYVWLVFILGLPIAYMVMNLKTTVRQKLDAFFEFVLKPLLHNPFWDFILEGAEDKFWPETQRGFFVMGNHRSFLDPFLLAAVVHVEASRKVCFLAKDFLFDIPVFGSVIKMGQNIPVHMNKTGTGTNKDKNNQICVDIMDRIRRGFAICVFPEGGIHTKEGIGHLKEGIFKIAVNNKIPVHVVGFSNNDHLVPDGWNAFMYPGSTVIRICREMFIETKSIEPLMEKVRYVLENPENDLCFL